MQKPLSMKGLFPSSLVTQLEDLANLAPIIFFVTFYTTIDVICAKTQFCSNMVVGTKLFVQTFVGWHGRAMSLFPNLALHDVLCWLAMLGTLSLVDKAIKKYATSILDTLTPTRWWCDTTHSHHVRRTPQCVP